ncbi:MAG: phage minor head protein [Chitinophagales bacterium]|nr:phage minor head protein [Chitinophagales bacterium]
MITLSDINASASDDMIEKLFNGTLKADEIEPKYYFSVAKKLQEAVKKGMNYDGALDPTKPETKLFEKLNANIFAFSAAKSLTQLQEFKKKLTDQNGELVSYGRFRQEVIPIDKEFNDNYLRTEYNSAVSMAQMANKWDKLKEFDMLEYRTVGDNRVRKSHKDLDGLRLPPDDPLWSKIYPPNDWGCRCTVLPVPGAKKNKREEGDLFSKQNIKPYFKRNVGTEQVIFNEDHPYFIRLPADLKNNKTHQFMAEENYGMRSVKQILKNDELPEVRTPKDKETAKKLWQELDKKIKTADGLEWELNDQWQHVEEEHKNEERWKFINHATDIIQNADEVWIVEDDNKIFKRYIKYYKGNPLVFSYNIKNPERWTVYDADKENSYSKLREKTRRGILIHRK